MKQPKRQDSSMWEVIQDHSWFLTYIAVVAILTVIVALWTS